MTCYFIDRFESFYKKETQRILLPTTKLQNI